MMEDTMKNSVETIIQDIKKLTKELEIAYGDIQPQLCEVNTSADSCLNKNCWVNRSRNAYFDRICDLENGVNDILESLGAANSLTPLELEIRNRLTKLVKQDSIDNEKAPKVAIQF